MLNYGRRAAEIMYPFNLRKKSAIKIFRQIDSGIGGKLNDGIDLR